MADAYVNPLYVGLLEAYGIDDDTAPTFNKDILRAWTDVFEANAQYRTKRDAGQLKRETDDIKARLGYIKSSRDLQAKLEETKGKDRRETVKAYVDRVNALTKARTDLAVQRSQFSDTVFSGARSAFEGPEGNAAKSADALFNTLNERGMKWSEGNPDTAGLATQWARMVLKQPDIQSVDPEAAAQAVRDAGGSDTLAANTARFIRVAQQADSMERSATAKLASEEERAKRLSAMSEMELAGLSEESIEDIVQGSANAQLAFETLLAETPEQMQERMNALAEADSQYASMVAREKQLASYVFGEGNEGAFTRTGRIIANPEFQAWAQDNGYNIGRAQVNADGELEFYSPGNADMRAIAAFNRQVKTGKPPRMFGSRNSGQLVRVTVTDPAARERVLQSNDLGGGRYAVADGAIISQTEYQKALEAQSLVPTGVQIATGADGTVFLKEPDGTVTALDKSGEKIEATPPADLKYSDAILYDGDTPVRYLTPDDVKAGVRRDSIGYPDAAEREAIAKSVKGIKVVGADQLPAVGEMQVLGYRDKLNARDMTQYGEGAFSINGGQYVFGRGAKVEILESRGREPVTNVLERRAATRAERAGLGGLPPEAVRRAEAGQTYREPGGVFPPAPAAGAAVPATAEADFLKPATAGIEVEGDALAPTAPAAPTAAAKAPTVDYIRGADGAVYRSTEGVGIQQISPRRGETRIDPRVYAEATPKFTALTERLFADGEPLSEEEGRREEMRDVGARERVPAPETQIREYRGSTLIGPGRTRTMRTDIEDVLGRIGARRRARGEAPAEAAAPPAGAPPAGAPPAATAPPTAAQRRTEAQRRLPPGIATAEEGVPGDVSKQRKPTTDRVGAFYAGMGALRDEALLRALKDAKPEQPGFDIAKRYAEAQKLKGTDTAARHALVVAPASGDAEAYYEEIARLAKEARRSPAGVVFTPGETEAPTAGYEARRAARREDIKGEIAYMPPETTDEKQRRAALDAMLDTRKAAAQAAGFREAARRAKYGEEDVADNFELKPSTPTIESQPSASRTQPKRGPLSTFKKFMPQRKLQTPPEDTEIANA